MLEFAATFNSTAVVCAPRGSLEDGSIMIRSSQNTSMRRLHCFRLIRISSVFVGIALVLSLARAAAEQSASLELSRPVRSWEFLAAVGTRAGIFGNEAGKDRKSTRLNSSHVAISYAVFCLKKKKIR